MRLSLEVNHWIWLLVIQDGFETFDQREMGKAEVVEDSYDMFEGLYEKPGLCRMLYY